jgi:phosphatidylglycerol---prolipoprotein diacylglyceryl transferase
MKQQARARIRQTAVIVPPRTVDTTSTQTSKSTPTSDGFTAFVDNAAQEILAVTYWFDPAPRPHPYPVTIQFSGRRLGVQGRLKSDDQFEHYETIDEVIPGSGPISVTARIENIQPGEWAVTAQAHATVSSVRKGQSREVVVPVSDPRHFIARFWRWWAPPVNVSPSIKTCLTPLAHVPGTIFGAWGLFVALGFILALVIQSMIIAHEHRVLGPVGMVEFVTIVAGIIGAKLWFMIKHRHERRWEGWCIQGFTSGAAVTLVIMLVTNHMPVGTFLDMTAPGMLTGMGIGRVGCFFAGCCGGPPTASRWGVWSSDQRVGARRVPVQLLETAFTLCLGFGALVAVLKYGSLGGACFVAAMAAYTLGRERILQLRAEPHQTGPGEIATMAIAALALVLSIVIIVLHIR